MSEHAGKPEIRFAGFTETWEQRNTSYLGNFFKGQGYSKADLLPVGTPIILYGQLYTNYQFTITEVNTYAQKKKNTILSKGNEVIVPASGETAEDIARASAVRKKGVILGGDLNIIVPIPSMNAEFFALSLSNGFPQKKLAQKAQGKSVVHIHNSDIQEISITYPSLEEQNRIVTFFRHLDRLITLHQRKRGRLENIKKAMLEKMFPKNGSDVPEIRFAGFTEAWEQRKLGELCNITTGKLDANAMVPDGRYDFYTSGIDVFKIDKAAFEGPAITIAGNGASVGYMHLADGKFNAYQRTYVLTDFSADRQFLNVAIGNELPNKIQEEVRGSGIPYIVLNMLTDLVTSLPSPKEQVAIGSFFESLDNLITLHQRKVALLKNIKKACLEKMFI
ncbi:MAG TPA: restriction endonuclease subunit S [Candidatus Mailhella merdigallinarum]|uniref:Restriction endonuclease subunit S n=1 Tax=Candidatus Mailhella merdigallinarum TaxID=2838658 RepID=A0A9D2KLI6_9BACT|nr:restriction endonuclease subunit S [Candidatus Mailhella merdigallinarum]